MIASVLAYLLLVVTAAAVRWRRQRQHARTTTRLAEHARRREFAARLAAEVEQVRLEDALAETRERLVCAERDRDDLQLIAAAHLRRAWRAERALSARGSVVEVTVDPGAVAAALAHELDVRQALAQSPVPDDASGLTR